MWLKGSNGGKWDVWFSWENGCFHGKMVVVHGKMVVFIGKLLFFMGTWPFFIWKLLFSIGKLLLFIGKLLFYGKTWGHMVFTCFYHVLMGRHHDHSWLYDVFECCFIKEDWDWVWHGLTDKHEDFKLQTCGWSKIMAQIQTLHRVLGPNRGHSKQYPTVSLIKFADFGAIGFDAPHFGANSDLDRTSASKSRRKSRLCGRQLVHSLLHHRCVVEARET